MSHRVHYLWLASEDGFLQSHQTTDGGVEVTRRHLKRGLTDFDDLAVGATVIELELDERERQLLGRTVHFNVQASPAFRAYVEEQLVLRLQRSLGGSSPRVVRRMRKASR